MSQTNTDINEYIKIYNQTWSALLESNTSLREYPNRNILTTWTLSYQEMEKACPNAAQMLQLWSCFDHNDLWYELFAAPLLRKVVSEAKLPGWYVQSISSQVEFTRVIQVLLNYSLAQPHSMPSAYSVHPVVHKWCYHRILENRNMKYRLGLIILGSVIPQATDPNFWVEERRLLSHCNQLSKHTKKISEISYGQNDEDKLVLNSYHNLGRLYSDQGMLQEAEAMYQRALEGFEKAWGPDHTSTLNTVGSLGNLYSKQGMLQEAEAMYQRALEGFEKAWGPDHTSTLNTVHNLGNLYSKQGKLQEAEAMYQRALEGYENSRGADHPTTLLIRTNQENLHKMKSLKGILSRLL